ncbi:MAG: SWIM zinc finger family protein [Infirmifilum sp.]|jgi:predicted nucleic acid-binding Zn finger protein|uniref:SWIM-type domain-containing protein n=2 Tax=Thermofilaceae TaxID=114378 RepID=A0A0F7CL68_9CREN|nr:hypothetical protein MA03_05935 [Infirmifilum uzonense]
MEGRVKQVIVENVRENVDVEVYMVESKDRRRSYIVIPGLFCSCEDFLFNAVYREKSKACYHMLAVELAIKEGIELKREKVSFEEFYKSFLASL